MTGSGPLGTVQSAVSADPAGDGGDAWATHHGERRAGRAVPAEQSAAAIRPLVDLIAGSDDALAAQAMTSVAALPLDVDAWHDVDRAVQARLADAPTTETIRHAARIPLTSVRETLRSIAAGADRERADAAIDGLVEVRDTETISRHLETVLTRHGWPALYPLSTEQLSKVRFGRRPRDPDAALWWVVATAKAGKTRPLRRFIEEIRRGRGPQVFHGDPAYVASLIAPARPVPPEVRDLVRREWERLEPHSEEARDVGILLEGLVGEEDS